MKFLPGAERKARGVRWNEETQTFEMRCDSCYEKRRDVGGAYWPVTEEFWSKTEGVQRCRACIREYKAKMEARRRAECKKDINRCRHRKHKHGRMKYDDSPGSGKEWYREEVA